MQNIETLRAREGVTYALDLETATEMALANQRRIAAILSKRVDQDEGRLVSVGSPSPRTHISDWVWRPLFAYYSQCIPADTLVHGNLHADFEEHDAMLMSFPALNDRWQPLLIQVVATIWRQIQVFILVQDENAEQSLMAKLRKVGVPDHGVRFFCMPTHTPWVRDYGPLVITTDVGVHRFVDARYDKDRFYDDHVPARLSRLARVAKLTTPLAIEGENLLTNGKGICLTTTRLLQENEAHGFSEEYVTNSIKRIFGATEVIYLKPLVGEGTGHVDMFAAFTDPRTIVVGDFHGIDPINAKVLDDNAERLSKIRTKTGPLKVVRIPMPPKQEESIGTYTNIVFANGILIVLVKRGSGN
ncbi:MAG: agmatine deiminase family protein [Planctomycetes bacterium]|nr:agmatine deiminase family protein [Planctomycetota bacterium]